MSDLIFESDSSGAERDLNSLTTAVQQLKKALLALNDVPLEKLKSQMGTVSTSALAAFSAIETRLQSLEKTVGAASAKSGEVVGRRMSEGVAKGVQAAGGEATAAMRKLSAQMEAEALSAAKAVRAATASAAAAYTSLSTGVIKDPFGGRAALRAKSAAKFTVDDFRNLVGAPSRDQMKSFAAQLKRQMTDDLSTEKLRVKSAGKFTVDDFRNLVGAPSRDQMKSFAAQLKRQMTDDLSTEKLRVKSAGKFTVDDFRNLVGAPSRDQMKSFAAQLKRQMTDDLSTEKLRVKSASKFTLEDFRNLVGAPPREQMRAFGAQLAAEMRASVAAERGAARRQVAMATANPSGAFSRLTGGGGQVASMLDQASAAARRQGAGFEEAVGPASRLTRGLNDMHSAARGVASGFGAMWLTWGNLGPLLAGAAVSNAFVQSIRKGAEFTNTLTAIEALAGESAESVNQIGKAALEMGSQGPYGPLQVAEAFKTLALAGQTAQEQLQSIASVKNFAMVGETDLNDAAEKLVSIGTAYGYTASELSVVGDVVAKTAASSMASVTDMAEAFKQASVVAQQYGVTLEDTSTTLALLSQIGIRGTAAGTAMRNMYTELMGTSKKARKVLEDTLKIDVWDEAANAMKPLPEIMEQMALSLSKMDTKSQQKALQELGNERGTKALAANLSALFDKFKEVEGGAKNSFEKIRAEIRNSAGYTAQAAAVMGTTTLNQIKSVGAALETSLVKGFMDAEPAIQAVAGQMRDLFNSPEFQGGVTQLVGNLAKLLQLLVDNADVLGTLAKIYITYKSAVLAAQVATLALGAATSVVTGLQRAFAATTTLVAGSAAVFRGSASAVMVLNSATMAMTGSAAGLTAGVVSLRGALGVLLRFLGPIGLAITAGAAAWSFFSSSSEEAAQKSGKSMEDVLSGEKSLRDSIQQEIKNLDARQKARDAGLEGAVAAAAVQKTLAEDRIEQIRKEKLALYDLMEAEVEASAKRKKSWLGWVPGMSDDIDVWKSGEMARIKAMREDANIDAMFDSASVQELMRKATAEAKQASDRIRENFRNRPEGPGTFDPDSLDARSGGGLSILKDNAIKEMERLYGIALQKTENFASAQKQILDAQRQAEAISQGAYAAKELDLTQETEMAQLAVITSYGQQTLRLYDERRAYLEKSLADLKASSKTPEQKKVGAERLNQELENLSNSQRTFVEGLAAQRDKVENSVYVRVQKVAISAQGEIRKLREEARKFEVEEQRRVADRADESEFKRATLNVGPGMAETLRAEFDEKKRLLAIDRQRTDAILEQERTIADFIAASKDSLSYILTGEYSVEQLATMDAMNQKLQTMKELRGALRAQTPGKVAAAGGDAAIDQLAGMGNLDLASAFDAAKISIDGMNLSLTDAVAALTNLKDQQDLYAKAKAAAGKDTAKLAKVESDAMRANIKGTGDLLKATKGFFKEKTAAYKVLDATEKAFRAAEIALAAQSFAAKMGWIGAETAAVVASEATKTTAEVAGTGVSLAQTATRTGAKAVEALVAQLTLPFPANIPAFAMVAGMLAALGVAVKGGKPSGSFGKTNEGKGTVLGDDDAQSESVTRSLNYLKELVTLSGVDLEYTARMANSLDSLVTQLGGVASIVTRNGSTEIAASGVRTGTKLSGLGKLASGVGGVVSSPLGALGLGAAGALGGWVSAASGGMLSSLGAFAGPLGAVAGVLLAKPLGKIMNSLFGTKVTVKGSGLYVGNTGFDDLMDNGVKLQSYADINKKKKTLGVTTSNKNSTKFEYAGDESSRQFSLALQSLGNTVLAAAAPLIGGMDKAEEILSQYTVKLGKINLKGLKGDEIEKKLTAVFSAEGDKMAAFILPQLRDMQQVGEGFLETIVRVSSSLELVNDTFNSLGYSLYESSVAGARLSVNLIEAFGGMEKFSSSMSGYYKNYYSLEERNTVLKDRLTKALQRLGFELPKTTADYRKMVDEYVAGGGLLSEAGRNIYAELITLSEPFYEYSEAVKELADGATSSAQKILDYVKKLQGDRAGLATPMQQLQAARASYVEDLAKARAGDTEAQDRLTDRADAYIEAQKAVTSSSAITQAVIDQIIAELTQVAGGIPAFASGGYHSGGWALVGEQGPELAYFGGAARIYNAQDTSAMLGGSSGNIEARLTALLLEVQALRAQQSMETREIVNSNAAVQQQATGVLLEGLSDAAERQAWVQQTQPVVK